MHKSRSISTSTLREQRAMRSSVLPWVSASSQPLTSELLLQFWHRKFVSCSPTAELYLKCQLLYLCQSSPLACLPLSFLTCFQPSTDSSLKSDQHLEPCYLLTDCSDDNHVLDKCHRTMNSSSWFCQILGTLTFCQLDLHAVHCSTKLPPNAYHQSTLTLFWLG